MDKWLPWVVAFIPLAVALVAGVNALLKQRDDRKQEVAATDVAQDNSQAERWKSIIETQTKVLLEPMKEQLREHADKIRGLEAELESRTSQYWNAISLIRALYLWIERNISVDQAKQPLPQPTDLISKDI